MSVEIRSAVGSTESGGRRAGGMMETQIPRNKIQIFRNEIQAGRNKIQTGGTKSKFKILHFLWRYYTSRSTEAEKVLP